MIRYCIIHLGGTTTYGRSVIHLTADVGNAEPCQNYVLRYLLYLRPELDGQNLKEASLHGTRASRAFCLTRCHCYYITTTHAASQGKRDDSSSPVKTHERNVCEIKRSRNTACR